jgi:hypothetical protein
VHVGLNLIFLVPGETGGMEVAARETIPALVAAAPPGTRFTAFVNREAGPGPWDELIEKIVVPVRVANRLEWVRGEQQLLRWARGSILFTRSRPPRLPGVGSPGSSPSMI